jgi:uncharacterized membrane protein YphA (DoxX/SURF4 family)
MFLRRISGIALALMRLAVTLTLLAQWHRHPGANHFAALGFMWVLAACLCVGLLTRLGAALAAVASLLGMFMSSPAEAATLAAGTLQAAALALLGPGAYSVDARLFGHRLVFRSNDAGRRDT